MDLRQSLARDINCLTDSDRSKRRRALSNIQRATQTVNSETWEVFRTDLQRPLLTTVGEAVERNREEAIGIVRHFLDEAAERERHSEATSSAGEEPEHQRAVLALTGPLVQVIASRIGSSPLVEPAEEIRLQLLQSLRVLLSLGFVAPEVLPRLTELINVLLHSAEDAFPSAKIEAARCLIATAKLLPSSIHRFLGSLVRAHLPNLGHQRAAVRQAVLQALGQVLPLGAEGLSQLLRETVFPPLANVAFDRSTAVRKTACAVVSVLLIRLPDPETQHPILLPQLLARVADDHDAVASAALDALIEASTSFTVADPAVATTEEGDDDEEQDDRGVDLPAPFDARPPPRRVRCWVRHYMNPMIDAALPSMRDWTSRRRRETLGLLRTLVVCVEDGITARLPDLLPVLCTASGKEDDPDIRPLLADVTALVGAFVPVDAFLAQLLPLLQGQVPGFAEGSARQSALKVFADALSGMDDAQVLPHLGEMTSTLAEPPLAETGSAEAPPLLDACRALVEITEESDPAALVAAAAEAPLHLAEALLRLASPTFPEPVRNEAVSLAERWARAVGYPSVSDLWRELATRIIDAWLPQAPTWEKHSDSRIMWDTMLRLAPSVLAEHGESCLAIFRATLDPSRSPDLRIAQLALLCTVIQAARPNPDEAAPQGGGSDRRALQETLHSLALPIITDVILPNLTWRAGHVASTIRKVAMACLHEGTVSEVFDGHVLFLAIARLLPVLKTTLSDDDAATRHLSCLFLHRGLAALEDKMDGDFGRQLFPDIVKRLDDSDDRVRLVTCDVLAAFLRVAPVSHMRGSPVEYITDALLLHADDQDPAMQAAATAALDTCVAIDPAYVLRQARASRTKHRSPDICDRVAQRALEAQEAAGEEGGSS